MGKPDGLRQLPGGFVALNLATPNPTVRVRDLDLRERQPGQLHALLAASPIRRHSLACQKIVVHRRWMEDIRLYDNKRTLFE